jgi:predicted nucleic acid-binding protein
MSVFVDTGVCYAHHDTDASRHAVGANALTAVLTSSDIDGVLSFDDDFDGIVERLVPSVVADS